MRPASLLRTILLPLASAALVASPASLGTPARAANISTSDMPDLAAYRGKVVYLDFWASWCGPCKLSFPFMAALQRHYGTSGLVILTVNVDHDRAAGERFMHENGGALPVVYDTAGALASRYRVATMPTTVLIGRDGRERMVHRGFFPTKADTYESDVIALLHDHS